jgi:hypothetical protein
MWVNERTEVRWSLTGRDLHGDGYRLQTGLTSFQVQHVVPEVTIPPEITPENVTTSIVDTSCECNIGQASMLHICIASNPSQGTCFADTPFPANPKSRTHLLSQLSRAHVICLVYSISDPSSFDRVAEYWLPLFRREGINVSGSVQKRAWWRWTLQPSEERGSGTLGEAR